MRDINFTDYDEKDIAEDAVDDLNNSFGSYKFTINTDTGLLDTTWTDIPHLSCKDIIQRNKHRR